MTSYALRRLTGLCGPPKPPPPTRFIKWGGPISCMDIPEEKP